MRKLDLVIQSLKYLPKNPKDFDKQDELIYAMAWHLLKEVGDSFVEEVKEDAKSNVVELFPSRVSPDDLLVDLFSRHNVGKKPSVMDPRPMQGDPLQFFTKSERARVLDGVKLNIKVTVADIEVDYSLLDAQKIYEKRHQNSSAFRSAFSKIWERPRLRGAEGSIRLNGRFSNQMFWSPGAAERVINTRGKIVIQNMINGGVVLEHIVPLQFIRKGFVALYEQDPRTAVDFLNEYVNHAAIAGHEDEVIRNNLGHEEEDALWKHIIGYHTLKEEELFLVRFGRYLEAPNIDLQAFKPLSLFQEDFIIQKHHKKLSVN